jgi:phosphatidyl-myo-inositol dimannoside synthase
MQLLMRVGIIAPEFPPDIGGMETYAYEVARELARRGHPVTVLTKYHENGEVAIDGVRVIPSLQGRWYLDQKLLRQWTDTADVWHVMNAAYSWLVFEKQPVVLSVHGNDFLNPNPVAGLDLKKRLRLPKGDRLDFSLAKWRTRRLLQRSLPLADAIIANSSFTENMLLERYPKCRGLTSVAYVGVSSAFLEANTSVSVRNGSPRLLTVCRLENPRKNVDLIIRALATLKDHYSFTYHVVGEGTLRPYLESLADRLNLSDCVRFHGTLDLDQLRRLYASSDLFVLTPSATPQNVEGFGIVYLEANACGTPVLASRKGGAAEAVKPGVSGLFVDPLTVNGVIDVLEKFLAGDIAFDRHKCRDFAKQFTWERVVDSVVACYGKP